MEVQGQAARALAGRRLNAAWGPGSVGASWFFKTQPGDAGRGAVRAKAQRGEHHPAKWGRVSTSAFRKPGRNGAGEEGGRGVGGRARGAELPDLHRQEGVRGRRGVPTGPDLYFRVMMPVPTAQRETGWEGR